MTRYLKLGILVISLSFSSFADHHVPNGVAHAMGIGGTVYQTWGLGYRQYFDNQWGATANIGGWFTSGHGRLGIAAGVLYTLVHHHFSHSSALPNSSIRVNAVGYLAGIYGHTYREDNSNLSEHYFNLGFGAGPGAEFFFNKHFAVHAELPWMTFFILPKITLDSKAPTLTLAVVSAIISRGIYA